MLNLTDKRLFSLWTPILKTGQVRLYQGLEKLCRHVAAMSNPHRAFLIDYLSKNVGLERDLAMSKNISFYYCFHSYPLGEAGFPG